MTDAVRKLVEAFDALPEEEKQTAIVALLRRSPPEGDVPLDALHAAADELFSALDAEETARAGR